jgi:hypothetical protein
MWRGGFTLDIGVSLSSQIFLRKKPHTSTMLPSLAILHVNLDLGPSTKFTHSQIASQATIF